MERPASTSPAVPRRQQIKTLNLSLEQSQLLKRTWKDDFETLYNLGAAIYEHIFREAPEAKTLFPSLASAGDNWKDCKAFRTQALKFIQVLSQSVKNVHRPEVLHPILIQVGRSHRKFRSRGFQPKLWTIFQASIEEAVNKEVIQKDSSLTDAERLDAITAWKHLAEHIISVMTWGFFLSDDDPTFPNGQYNTSSSSTPL